MKIYEIYFIVFLKCRSTSLIKKVFWFEQWNTQDRGHKMVPVRDKKILQKEVKRDDAGVCQYWCYQGSSDVSDRTI